MLVDATHQEETRIVVTSGNQLEEFDFESASKRQLRGNIYLAKVTRVEPSLQACFVEYGGNRQGFLAFSEIHPDYYQIPVADREALHIAEKQHGLETETSNGDDNEVQQASKSTNENANDSNLDDVTNIEVLDEDIEFEEVDQSIEQIGGEDPLEENVLEEKKLPIKRYKIQEVIRRRQVMLVQVVKEERQNKGAALTTYLSLAGRYSVLMPNTAKGGGISRKITNEGDRKRLKEIASSLSIPEGMGIILRTAGASRTKAEIKRDFEYLMRLWENVRSLTLNSSAPCLVYEEGSLIKRTIRDLYSKEIDELLVAGNTAYIEAKDFMRMIMPSHAKKVKLYKGEQPIFSKYKVEQQLDQMFSPQVTLPSGGYIVINPTEALVSIDVNSGKATKERNIEATALQTNLEAASEVARQLRLRDMAGLVVIDFIDMIDKKSIRSVERKLKDNLRHDRARIQVGRISHFGLLEMSRQRMRFGVLESSTNTCPTCLGAGIVRSVESLALMVVRAIEDHVQRKPGNSINVKVSADVASFILNAKRDSLSYLESKNDISISVFADVLMSGNNFEIEKGEKRQNFIKTASHVKADSAIMQDIEITTDEQTKKSPASKNRQRGRRGRYKSASDIDINGQQEISDITKAKNIDNVVNIKDDKNSKEEPSKKSRRSRRGAKRTKFSNSNLILAPTDVVGVAVKIVGNEEAHADDANDANEELIKQEPMQEKSKSRAQKTKTKPKNKKTQQEKEETKEKEVKKLDKDEIIITSNESNKETSKETKKAGWWQRGFFG